MVDIRKLSPGQRKHAKRTIEIDNESYGNEFVEVKAPASTIAGMKNAPIKCLRNKRFLVQVYALPDGVFRISVNKAMIDAKSGEWLDGITWDELQRVKSQVGFGSYDAVEVYPADEHLVNAANIRHLFVMPDKRLEFVWRNKNETQIQTRIPPQKIRHYRQGHVWGVNSERGGFAGWGACEHGSGVDE